MVPDVEFTSYYGRPVIKEPAWGVPDVPGYLFLGGLAGASSVLAAGAELSGYGELARVAKVGALGAISLSAVALVHDLGRPERFLNMLRVFKPSSPMSVGSWLLAAYGPVAGAAAVSDVTGILPAAGTRGHARRGPARPGHRHLYRRPDLRHRGAGLARGLPGDAVRVRGLRGQRGGRPRPARAATRGRRARPHPGRARCLGRTRRQAAAAAPRLGDLAEPYETGTTGALLRVAEFLTAGGLAGAVLGRRNRAVSALAGASLLAASALTRFGVFEAGMASARDPKYTIVPQRRRR